MTVCIIRSVLTSDWYQYLPIFRAETRYGIGSEVDVKGQTLVMKNLSTRVWTSDEHLGDRGLTMVQEVAGSSLLQNPTLKERGHSEPKYIRVEPTSSWLIVQSTNSLIRSSQKTESLPLSLLSFFGLQIQTCPKRLKQRPRAQQSDLHQPMLVLMNLQEFQYRMKSRCRKKHLKVSATGIRFMQTDLQMVQDLLPRLHSLQPQIPPQQGALCLGGWETCAWPRRQWGAGGTAEQPCS